MQEKSINLIYIRWDGRDLFVPWKATNGDLSDAKKLIQEYRDHYGNDKTEFEVRPLKFYDVGGSQ